MKKEYWILFSVLLVASFFLDKYIFSSIENFLSPFLFLLMYYLSHILFLIIVVIGCSYLIKKKKEIFYFYIGIAMSYIISILLKLLVRRTRPFGAELVLNEFSLYSFPSSHATVYFFIFAFMAAHFDKHKDKRNKNFKYYFLIIAVLVSFSRVYLGTHYLSDVIGGGLLGIGIYMIYRKWIKTWS
ncbi:phosphatase PAP2 family protein [Candidatus Woesearchaeota archaeon]|nr:phosphatase PAP2 family protein [Candidatus Woesearchaeota archaeon]